MSTTDSLDPIIIGALERLKDDSDFQTFCRYLIEMHKDDVHNLMVSSDPGNSKISAETFARSKIYDTLGELPRMLYEKLIEKPKPKKSSNVYAG